MPKVSIIIPVYNASKTIERCISSVIYQDYKDFEIIAVDDGSKDKTSKILDDLAKLDKRLKVIHKKNEGVSKARNVGIEASSGKYIQFIDADDYLPKNSTKILVRSMEDSKVDMVIGNFYRVVKDNVAVKSSISTNKILTLQQYAEEMMESPSDFYYGVLWNKLYKASIIKKNNLKMDESLSFCEDFIFNMEYLIHCKKIEPLQVPIYYYLKTEGSLVSQSVNFTNMVNTKVIVYSYYTQFFKNVLDEKQYAKDRIAIARFLIDGAKDDNAFSIMPSTKKLGEEKITTHFLDLDSHDIYLLSYYSNKLLDSHLQTIAYKYDLDLKDIKILYSIYLINKPTYNQILDLTGFGKISLTRRLEMLSFKKYIVINSKKQENHYTLGKNTKGIVKDFKIAGEDVNSILYENFNSKEKEDINDYLMRISKNIKKYL